MLKINIGLKTTLVKKVKHTSAGTVIDPELDKELEKNEKLIIKI